MKTPVTPVLFSALLMVSATAQAGHHEKDGHPPCKDGQCPHHAMIDTDKDGKISDAERAAWQTKKFDAADTNKDGQLSREEFMAMPRHHGKKH
jgi:hypothetical protein